MLEISVPEYEFYDANKNMFFYTKPMTVRLEHSLISISKWESEYKKPFLPSSTQPGITGQTEELYYIICMIIGNVPDWMPKILYDNYGDEIREYMGDTRTASVIYRPFDNNKSPAKTVTSELVYWWMIRFQIPFECDKWHFNRLLTLIDICNEKEKQATGGKASHLGAKESAKYRHELNKQRKEALKNGGV